MDEDPPPAPHPRGDLRALASRLSLSPRPNWSALPGAVAASLPPLLASLMIMLSLVGPPLARQNLSFLGPTVVVLCLIAAWLLPRLSLPGHLACLSTAGTLGLVVPALSLHLTLAGRALLDPARIVLAPAVATGALLVVALTVTLTLLVSRRPHPLLVRTASLAPCLLPVWLVGLVWRPDERLILGAVAFTLAVSALASLLAAWLRGWQSWLALLLAIGIVWLLAGSIPPAPLTPTRGLIAMRGAHLGLAIVSSLLPLLLPPLLPWLARPRIIPTWLTRQSAPTSASVDPAEAPPASNR